MLEEISFLSLVKDIAKLEHVNMDKSFQELGMDSTNIVELLIECEIQLDIDLLDADMNLDDFKTLQDAYDFILITSSKMK